MVQRVGVHVTEGNNVTATMSRVAAVAIPLSSTPMQATLMRSLAPRTFPTYGKTNAAVPAAMEVRLIKSRRVSVFISAFEFLYGRIPARLASPALARTGIPVPVLPTTLLAWVGAGKADKQGARRTWRAGGQAGKGV